MTPDPRLVAVKRLGSGAAFIGFPVLLLSGFLLHPNLLSFDLVTSADAWADEFRGNVLFHVGHLLVLLTVPLIIVVGVRCMAFDTGPGAWLVVIGGAVGVVGAFILAVDKGALTLVLTAFDTLPDAEFERMEPALQALLDREGGLWMVRLLVLLPLGFAVQAIGLAQAGVIGRFQAAVIVVGLSFLLAGDIEIITSVGALLMGIGYVPMGIRELRGRLEPGPRP